MKNNVPRLRNVRRKWCPECGAFSVEQSTGSGCLARCTKCGRPGSDRCEWVTVEIWDAAPAVVRA